MNNTQNTVARISEIVSKGASGVIVIPPNPTIDTQAAAVSLYLGLIKLGKNVSLACSVKPESGVFGADKIKTQFATGGDSLMISFPYSDGSIDKVDYNIQGEFFNLIVTPRPGFAKLDPKSVSFSYTGGVVDFIVVVDAPTLNTLGSIYSDNQNQFTGKDIINIDRHLTNSYFGTVNYVNKTASSISELILTMLLQLKVEIDRDMATNLYSGIAAATNNFTSYSVTADTFEHTATLLRAGAVKKIIKKPEAVKMNYSFSPEFQTTPIKGVEREKTPQETLRPKIFKNSELI